MKIDWNRRSSEPAGLRPRPPLAVLATLDTRVGDLDVRLERLANGLIRARFALPNGGQHTMPLGATSFSVALDTVRGLLEGNAQ